jgi:hypothetical protein
MYAMITQFTALNLYAVKYDRIPNLKSVKYILISQMHNSSSEHTELNGWNIGDIFVLWAIKQNSEHLVTSKTYFVFNNHDLHLLPSP